MRHGPQRPRRAGGAGAVNILGKLAKSIDNVEKHLTDIAAVLSACLSHSSVDAQCASVDAVCKLLSEAEVDEQTQRAEQGLSRHPCAARAAGAGWRRGAGSVKVVGSLLELLLKGEGEGELMKGVMDRFAVLMSVTVCAGTPYPTACSRARCCRRLPRRCLASCHIAVRIRRSAEC